MVLIVDGGVEAAIVTKLAHMVEQLVGLQVDPLGAQDLQGSLQGQALLVGAAAAGVRLVNLRRFF